jgi:hypothetical protein
MTAQLDLINEPGGLKPANAAKLDFDVNDDRRTSFIADWGGKLAFTKQARPTFFDPAMPAKVEYIGGGQEFRMLTGLKTAGFTNPGLSFFAKVGIHRGAVKLAESIDAFPHDQSRSPTFETNIAPPNPFPVVGTDALDFKFDLLDTDRTTILKSEVVAIPVHPETVFTAADAIAKATADDAWLHGMGPTELLGLLTAKGGREAKLADAIGGPNPIVELKPFTLRHDSATYVASAMGATGQSAFFEGVGPYGPHPDPNTTIDSPARPAYALRNKLFLNRTLDVPSGAKRSPAEMVTNAIHEGTHAVDEWDIRTPAEDYKSEFRAYWNEGRFGPPDVAIPPPPGLPTTIDPTMAPPGPKSPRARAIFNHVRSGYGYVRESYESNKDGFREMADNYTHPEGLNLNFSPGLDALQNKIRGYKAATFPALHTTVKGFFGVGPAPPTGVLNAGEQDEITRQRSWGILLDRFVTTPAHRAALAATLKLP